MGESKQNTNQRPASVIMPQLTSAGSRIVNITFGEGTLWATGQIFLAKEAIGCKYLLADTSLCSVFIWEHSCIGYMNFYQASKGYKKTEQAPIEDLLGLHCHKCSGPLFSPTVPLNKAVVSHWGLVLAFCFDWDNASCCWLLCLPG